MGVLGDTFDEFKKASPTEKVFIVGGIAAVVAIALYVHNQSTQQQPATGAGTGTGLGGQGTSGGGVQTVPGPNSSNIPILPSGLCAQFDPQGNLINYAPCSTTPTPTPTPTPGGSGTPIPWLTPLFGGGKLPNNIPAKLGQHATINGTKWTIVPGSNGIVWGVNGWVTGEQAQNTPIGAGQKQILVAPSGYKPPTNITQGGGPFGTRVLGIHRGRIAPTKEGHRQYTHATKIMAMRNRY